MMYWIRSFRAVGLAVGATSVAAFLVAGLSRDALGYTTESREVRALVDRAVSYLESTKGTDNFGVGGESLVALALYKAGQPKSHPMIQEAIAKARRAADRASIGHSVYGLAIACIFLCEVDSEGSSAEINTALRAMLERQRPNGCWGYTPFTGNDNSQTQYGVLCLWSAFNHGFDVPADSVERAANFLIRTQDIGGGFVYMPSDTGGQRQKQNNVTHSMSAAGLGSVYVVAHLLGFSADVNPPNVMEEGVPDALEKVEEREDIKDTKFLHPTGTSAQQIRDTQMAGNAWFAKNLTYEVKGWTHYYMYAVERYKSFQETVEGIQVEQPEWYNSGVDHLARTQLPGGSWRTEKSHGSGPPVDTAFAVLFLTRSSRQSIDRAVMNEGTLHSGYKLPKNTTNVQINEDGQVVSPQMVQEVDDILELIENSSDTVFDATSLPGGLTPDDDFTKRNSQLKRLREMVNAKDFHARLAAVKTLARARELDNVPALIYALSDPDSRVISEARDGLRFISRRFYGFGLPDNPSKAQVQTAQDKWRDWYLSIRPDGALPE